VGACGRGFGNKQNAAKLSLDVAGLIVDGGGGNVGEND